MNRNILFIIFLMISVCGVSQNIKYSYTSNFAKLQDELEKEFGLKKMHTINFSDLTTDDEPYSLQIIGTSNYKSFLSKSKIYDVVRILYIDNVDFKLINNFVFDKLKNLKAIRINNSKNINFNELISNLFLSKHLTQLHFKSLKFGNWHLNVNKLSWLKVLTLDNCRIKKFSKMSLNLDEFSISNSKNTLDLSTLFINSAKKVIIKDCIIKTFPYSLSTSKGLEYLDLTGTRIKAQINGDIRGFKSLLYLDITDARVNFKTVRFLDVNERLFVIRESGVSDDLIINNKY